jgi:hypothetical protein
LPPFFILELSPFFILELSLYSSPGYNNNISQ